MASTAHKDAEAMKERYDSEEDFEQKLDQLAELVKKSKHMIFFTGAGVSTSTGIPDFRGPEGVWTLKAQGRERKGARTDSLSAVPSVAHRAIVKLQKEGICKYLISQNCDGLHRRSGIAPNMISELHGNGNIEYCESCGFEYLRDFHCYRLVRGSRDHYTGRHCVQPIDDAGKICNGRLMNSTIDFGQNLPEEPLKLAELNSKKSDLHIVLGSSLTVSPACQMPEKTATYQTSLKPVRGKLVIVNLQNTPLDHLAFIRIYQKCDKVMEALMQRLNLPIPPFLLNRYCKISLQLTPSNWRFQVAGIEKGTTKGFEIPASIFKAVQVHCHNKITNSTKTVDLETDPFLVHFKSSCTFKDSSLSVTLHFMGHYNEPPLTLPFNFPVPNAEENTYLYEVKHELSYNPLTGEWTSSLASANNVNINNIIIDDNNNK